MPHEADADDYWIPIRDLARQVGMSPVAVYQWVRRGKLPAMKRGGRIVVESGKALAVLQRPYRGGQ
jgi:predicted site-specific integrase-resolvase